MKPEQSRVFRRIAKVQRLGDKIYRALLALGVDAHDAHCPRTRANADELLAILNGVGRPLWDPEKLTRDLCDETREDGA